MLLSRLGRKEYENKPQRTKCFTSVHIHPSAQKDSNSERTSQEQCKHCELSRHEVIYKAVKP